MRGTVWSIGFRLVSFVCTQLTLRWVDPIALGKANIDLELALGFVLFLSREGYRLVLSKQWDETLAYTSRRWNVILAILVWIGWLVYIFELQKGESSILLSIQDYILAGTFYCLAAILEGWAEPYILRALFEMRLDHKVYAEGVATVTKTFVTVLLMGLFGSSYYPVSVFGIAQLAYAMAYYLLLRTRVVPMTRMTERIVTNSKATSELLRNQIRLFTLQGLFKHALTEGDRLILVILLSHTSKGSYDKGLYALASAYGSMVARLLFQPLEENARLLWSKQASTSNTINPATDELAIKQQLEQQQQLYLSYTTLVKLVSYIGLTLAAFGSNYTDILLQLLGGSSRRAAAPVLSAYCVYTLTMAWNGMTEAFWYATASSKTHVAQLSVIHMIIGIISYGVLAPQLVIRHGTIGLVMANIVAMLLRTIYAIRFATIHFTGGSNGLLQKHGTISLVLAILPHPMILIAYLVTYVLTKGSCQQFLQQEEEFRLNGQELSMEWFRLAGYHISVGVTCLFGVLSAIILLEHSYLQTLLTFFRKDHHTKIKTS
jgi:Rft protein